MSAIRLLPWHFTIVVFHCLYFKMIKETNICKIMMEKPLRKCELWILQTWETEKNWSGLCPVTGIVNMYCTINVLIIIPHEYQLYWTIISACSVLHFRSNYLSYSSLIMHFQHKTHSTSKYSNNSGNTQGILKHMLQEK